MPYEGQTGTAPDGTRVVYRGGKIYPVDAAAKAPADVKTDLGYINAAKDEGNNLLSSATQMERFVNLNRKMPTGPGMGLKLPFLPSVGDAFVKPVSPTYQDMQAISAHLTPRERPAGSGQTSNFEEKLYAQAIPGVDKFGTTNEAIKDARVQEAAKAKARGTFLDRYYTKTGSLSGADAAFDHFWNIYQPQHFGAGPTAAPDNGAFQGKFGTVRPMGK